MTTALSTGEEEIADNGVGETTMERLNYDVLHNILQRLDGISLVNTSCVNSDFRRFCSSEQALWKNLCRKSCPSCKDPIISRIIDTLENKYQTFFSDAIPLISANLEPGSGCRYQPEKLISAVDIHHRGKLILSKVIETSTNSNWFCTTPFQIDLLSQINKSTMEPVFDDPNSGDLYKTLYNELTMNWVIIDPVICRAVNLSSRKPVSVQKHWYSGETQVRFSTVVGNSEEGMYLFGIVATCEGYESSKDDLQVTEVSLTVEDMDGKHLNGENSLGLLRMVMGGERKKIEEEDIEERYMEYLDTKRARLQRMKKREERLDAACLGFGIAIFSVFCTFMILS